MEDKHIYGGNSLYRSISNNILKEISQCKSDGPTEGYFNEKIFCNVYSMLKLFEQKDIGEKEKSLDCFVPFIKVGTAIDKDSNDNGERVDDKLAKSPWENDIQFSIADSKMIYEDDSKMMTMTYDDYGIPQSANIFDMDIKEKGNEMPMMNIDNNHNGINEDRDRDRDMNDYDNDFPAFKKEDLIISIPKRKNQSKKSTTLINGNDINIDQSPSSNDNINSLQITKPQINKSSLSDDSNTSNTNSKIRNYSNTSFNKPSSSNTCSSNLDFHLSFKDGELDKALDPHYNPSASLISSIDHIHLSPKIKSYYLNQMSKEYLHYMSLLYNKIKAKSQKEISLSNDIDQLMFINVFKGFILSIGISEKKFYEDTLRNLVYQRENFTLEIFLSSFTQVLKYRQKEALIKFKFLLNIINVNQEEYSIQEVKSFYELMKGKMVYEDIVDVITKNLILKYDTFFKKRSNKTYNVKRLALLLETFFGQ